MNRTAKWFWTIVAAQALFLLAWAGYHEFVRQNAPVLLLKGRPVDPQDLLRGDYLTLNYDISTVVSLNHSLSKIEELEGVNVWVLLEKRGRYYEVVQASREPIAAAHGQVLARGSIGHDWRNGTEAVRVNYGIEKYFVPEGHGSPKFKLMEVEVSVSPAHRLYIKRVLLDGQSFP